MIMKKYVFLFAALLISVASWAQKDVTTFLGIPVDGYKNEMKQKLIEKGFTYDSTFDMLEGELKENTIKILEQKIINNNCTLSTGFVGTGVLCQTLAKVGLNDLAYDLLLQENDPSWLYSVKQGATTIWERWNSYTKDDGFGNVKMNSFNHYAYGAVVEWMYGLMAGIRPDAESGCFILAPLPDGKKRITSVKAKHRDFVSEWNYEGDQFVWRVVIPSGFARVEFPLINGRKTLEINGITFDKKALYGEIIDGKMVFELTEGEYIIK